MMLKVYVASLSDPALLGKARVAREGSTTRFHTEADGVFEVPRTAHYLRRIQRGELVLAAQTPTEVETRPIRPPRDRAHTHTEE